MENKTLIGKVDDVYGPITAPGIAIKPTEGVKGESFQKGDKVRPSQYFRRYIFVNRCVVYMNSSSSDLTTLDLFTLIIFIGLR